MRFAARLLLALFLILTFSFSFVPFAHAQQYTNPYVAPNTDPNVPPGLHTYTQSLLIEMLAAFTCQIVGVDPITSTHICLGINTSTGKIGYVSSSGGAIGFVGVMIASLYTPPVKTGDYVNYVSSNFGLVKHTYAAGNPSINSSSVTGCSNSGCGFDKLTPLLGLWTTFRNITYLAFVVIFIGIGFAIMLRVKIDPRTVMTIENQIPKIIVALLLVTFSYAIAGFLIDMMYAATYLTINVVTNSQAVSSGEVDQIHNTERSDLAGGNPFGFANDIIPGGIVNLSGGSAGSVKDLVSNMLTGSIPTNEKPGVGGVVKGAGIGAGLGAVIGFFLAGPPGALVLGALGALFGGGAASSGLDVGQVVLNAFGTLLGIVASLLAFLIITFAILIALFRVWFSLLMAYIGILLDVVLAPFYIIAGVFPGSKVGFGLWLRDIVGNLLAFPVTVGMFLLASVFMDTFATSGKNVFVPPLIGNVNGTIGGQSPVAYLIALGMILLTPNVVTITRGLLKAPKNQQLQIIAGNLGAGFTPLGEGVKGVMNYTQKSLYDPRKMQGWRGVVGGLFRF